MLFVPSTSELFNNADFKLSFEHELQQLIIASGNTHEDFFKLALEIRASDNNSYKVPDQISAAKLASFYYAQIADRLENAFFDEIDQDLFEVTARGHD